MYSQHHRFRIWNQLQHPYSHTLEEFGYINEALPVNEVTNLKQTIDWLVAVLYPQTKDAVDTFADLPTVGNTIGDYRVVLADETQGGVATAYRWQQLEGDATPDWYILYSMDWGEQTVLSNFLLKTQDVYVYRYGIDDLDETGTPYAGDLAGQRIYGGSSANTHITLYANSGDGAFYTPTTISQTIQNGSLAVNSSNDWYGTSFTENINEILSVSVRIARIGSPVTGVKIRIYDDNGSNEPNTQIAESQVINAATLSTTPTLVNFTFAAPVAITALNTYHLQVVPDSPVTIDPANTYSLYRNSSGASYPNGNLVYTNNSGTSWNQSVWDFVFEIFGALGGVSANTGYIQAADDVRPLTGSQFLLGTPTNRWLNFYTDEANVGTMQIQGGSITDSSGAIDFGATNLGTTGTLAVGDFLLSDLTVPDRGSITHVSGLIDFDNENLVTTGYVDSPDIRSGDTRISDNQVSTAAGNLELTSFTGTVDVTGDLVVTGNITGAFGYFKDQIEINSSDDLETTRITTFTNGIARYQTVNGGSHDFFDSSTQVATLDATNITLRRPVDFTNSPTSWFNGATEYLRVTSGRIDSLTVPLTIDGGATLRLEAGTNIQATKRFYPTVDNSLDLGLNLADNGLNLRWRTLSLSDAISDGTNEILMSVLLSLRDIQVGVADKYGIWWDAATSKFIASAADDEIDHGNILGLGDDDHAQYLYTVDIGAGVFGGRSGGQYLTGGTDASDNLYLDSTSNATKGVIEVRSSVVPGTTGLYDLGASGNTFRDLYLAGQAYGLELENVTTGTLPAAGNTGRIVWATDIDAIYVDNGTILKKIVSDKLVFDHPVGYPTGYWDGTRTTFTYTSLEGITANFDDARLAIWQFLDNTNGFREVNGAVITKTATSVTVAFSIAPPSGTYRLVGVG